MKNNETYDLIEAYLQDKLTGDDKLSFENRLLEDKVLNKKYLYHKLSNQILIEQRLKGFNAELKNRVAQKNNSWKIITALIVITLLAVVTVYYVKNVIDSQVAIKEAALNDNEVGPTIILDEVGNSTILVDSSVSSKEVTEIKKNNYEDKADVLVLVSVTDTVSVDTTSNETKQKKELIITDFVVLDTAVNKEILRVVDTSKDKLLEVLVEKEGLDLEIDNEDLLTSENNVIENDRVYLEVSPLYNEFDEFPFDEFESGHMEVYSKQGKLVKSIEIIDGEPSYWDGKDNNGIITPGYYIYRFENSLNRLSTGGITVIY